MATTETVQLTFPEVCWYLVCDP